MGRAGNTALETGVLGEMVGKRRGAAVAASSVDVAAVDQDTQRFVEVIPGFFVKEETYVASKHAHEAKQLAEFDSLVAEVDERLFRERLSSPSASYLERLNVFALGKEAIRRELEQSFGSYVSSYRSPDSTIVSAKLEDIFGLRLAAAHGFNGAAVEKTSFEHAFVRALRDSGHDAYKTANKTHPGEDVVVDGIPYSLKTEGAKRAKPNQTTISKLMEAAWCQGLTSRKQAVALLPRILEHLGHYEKILVLRNLDLSAYDKTVEPETTIRYSLVEIPKSVLGEISKLKVSDFSSPGRTRKGSTFAQVKIDGEPAFTLRFDGSQGKVQIVNLNLDLCCLHATWDVTHPDRIENRMAQLVEGTAVHTVEAMAADPVSTTIASSPALAKLARDDLMAFLAGDDLLGRLLPALDPVALRETLERRLAEERRRNT